MDTPSPDLRIHEARDLVARRRRLVRAAGRVLRDDSGAEDVAQDALLADLRRDAAPIPAPGWWRVVGRRLASRWWRGEERRHRREREVAHGVLTEDGPLSRSLDRERAQAVRAAIRSVPEPFRRTLVERYLHERSIAEIAAADGVSPRTVESRIRRGLERLRPLLRSHDPRFLGSLLLGTKEFAGAASPLLGPLLTTGLVSMKLGSVGIAFVAAAGLWWWSPWSDSSTPAEVPAPEIDASTHSAEPVAPAEPNVSRVVDAPALVERPEAVEDRAVEPTRAQLAAFRETLPPRTLAGRVLRQLEPVANAEVRALHGATFSDLERPWWDRAELRTFTDAEGRFRFEQVEAGDWVVGVDAGSGLVREFFLRVEEDERRNSLLLVLGGSSLEGTVHDPGGLPNHGALVHLSLRSAGAATTKGDDFHAFAFTDLHGHYRVDHLLSGSYWVSFEPNGQFAYWYSEDSHSVPVEIPVDTVVHLDDGSAEGLPRVEGHLVARDGSALRASGTIRLISADEDLRQVDFDEQGRFELRCPPGSYQVLVTVSGHQVPLSEPFSVEAGFAERRITLPGTRLVGSLHRDGTDPDRLPPHQVWLTDESGRSFFVQSERGGAFVIEGLLPGTWTMRTHPLSLDRPDGKLTLPLDGSRETVVVEERLRRP